MPAAAPRGTPLGIKATIEPLVYYGLMVFYKVFKVLNCFGIGYYWDIGGFDMISYGLLCCTTGGEYRDIDGCTLWQFIKIDTGTGH